MHSILLFTIILSQNQTEFLSPRAPFLLQLQCCDDYHDYLCEPKPHNLDHNATATPFNDDGWGPALDALLGQGYQQHGHEHSPIGYYGMATSPLTLTPDTVPAMAAVSPHRPSTPSTSSPSDPYIHPNVFQQNHHHHHHQQQQTITDHPPSFHSIAQPGKDFTFESNTPTPPDLSQVQPQSHLAVGRVNATGEHSCMWADCHAAFGSLQDLATHVNIQHLQIPSTSSSANNQLVPSQDPACSRYQPAPALNSTNQVFPSCHWGDCHVYPTAEGVPSSSDRPLDAALGVLAAHLWEYHLGLPSPPPQFTFPPSSTTFVTEDVEAMDVAVVDPSVGDAPTPSELSPASPHEDAFGLAQDKTHSHDQGHDCTMTDHPCKWLDCQERFATCQTLMAHITAEHVGGGKNHYGCFWDGCGRNGDKGFKSKQKICRHLQVCPSRSKHCPL